MKRKINAFQFGLLLLVTTVILGCAAIIHGSKQDIAVSSSPTGARVLVMGAERATTPGVIELRRKDTNIVLRFEKEGYEAVEVALSRSVDGWIAGNILFGGVIGLVVDFATGAAYKLKPSEVNAVLERKGMSIKDLLKDCDVVVFVDMEVMKR